MHQSIKANESCVCGGSNYMRSTTPNQNVSNEISSLVFMKIDSFKSRISSVILASIYKHVWYARHKKTIGKTQRYREGKNRRNAAYAGLWNWIVALSQNAILYIAQLRKTLYWHDIRHKSQENYYRLTYIAF